ncbi:MAG TPA: hypothetical protein VJA16_08615 [Thermoanaerobaculia bacterium]
MDARLRRWTADSASRWLRQLQAEEPVEPPVNEQERERILRVCSVLAQFPAIGLRSAEGPIAERELRDALGRDLARVPSPAGQVPRFTLRPQARRQGLASLGNLRRMRELRRLNGIEPAGVVQRVLDEYLEEDFSAAASDDVERLDAALEVSGWLRGFAPAMPAPGAIEMRRARRRLLQPMERLTAGFMGRDGEPRARC